MLAHYTAHARGELTPLADDECARWLWQKLRGVFPEALAVSLMPDHPHLIAPAGRDEAFRCTLVAFSRWFGFGALWAKVPAAEVLSTPDKVSRGVRYTSLNPSRPTKLRGHTVKLVHDPLEWKWSTHRDVVGCSADPWVTAERLQRELGWEGGDFLASFHRYVSSDAHVCVAGTPLPIAATPSDVPGGPLERVRDAVLAATRAHPDDILRRTPARRLFIQLAHRQGWRRFRAPLALLCNVHPDSVTRITTRRRDAVALAAAARCLGDERLLGRRSVGLAMASACERRPNRRSLSQGAAEGAPEGAGAASSRMT